MKLLIDIGNSRLKWARLARDNFRYEGAIDSREKPIHQLLDVIWGDITEPDEILVANVNGWETEELMREWVLQNFQTRIDFVETLPDYKGLKNAYHNPLQLGVDRWMGMVAARMLYENQSFCIFGCGTSITVDVVNARGEHQGGLIAPGLDLMQSSLMRRTQLNEYTDPPSKKILESSALAKNPYRAIKQGQIYMCVSFINQLTQELFDTFGNDLKCIITGGDARTFLPFLDHEYNEQPYLVLHGLAEMAH